MKLFILTLTFLFFGQTFVVAQGSQSYIQSMLDKKNTQYDDDFSTVQTAFQKLINLQLVNMENIKLLGVYQENAKKYAPNISNTDYSIPANVDWALEFINRYFANNKSIKDEMDLLGKISLELQVMKNSNPHKWTETAGIKN